MRQAALPLGILAACIVALVGVRSVTATSGFEESPNRFVGQLGNGDLVYGDWDPYVSADGGLTWETAHWSRLNDSVRVPYHEQWSRNSVEVEWGSQEAETPRGTYSIEEGVLVRVPAGSGEREEVYSPPRLNGAHERFADFLYHHHECSYGCEPRLRNVVYHAATGKVVVSMATGGLLVVEEEGGWKRLYCSGGFRPSIVSWARARPFLG